MTEIVSLRTGYSWCPVCGEGQVPDSLEMLVRSILATEARTREMEVGIRGSSGSC